MDKKTYDIHIKDISDYVDLESVMIELKGLSMNAVPLMYLNCYFNVPGGDRLSFNFNLIHWIEKIGQKYGTIRGSNLKKGIHYIKTQTGCTSNRQIKMMLRNVRCACIHNLNDDAYIYRCSKKYYVKVLEFIVKCSIFQNLSGESNANYLIRPVQSGLIYMSSFGKDDKILATANLILDKTKSL